MKRTQAQTGSPQLLPDAKRPTLARGLQHLATASGSYGSEVSEDGDVEMIDDSHGDVPDNSRVCFGAFPDSKAKLSATGISTSQLEHKPWEEYVQLQLSNRATETGSCQIFHGHGGCSTQDGVLDMVTSKYVDLLGSFQDLSFEVVLSSQSLDSLRTRGKKISTIIDVSVNILGPAEYADRVGDTLLKQSCFLQHPISLTSGIKYINPQYFYCGDGRDDLRALIGPALKVDDQVASRRLHSGIEDILASLAEPEEGTEPEQTSMTTDFLETNLKPHQINAIRFIQNSETRELRRSVLRDLQVLFGNERQRKAESIEIDARTGGILADVMGLGKTLTMLTVIACSKEAAEKHRETRAQDEAQLNAARGTLVVVTSRQILEVWRHEVTSHFCPGCLSVGIFHGTGRAKRPQELSNYDVVLTTYSTLMSDWSPKGQRTLQKVAWFRVVLDEAHWIRNSNTKQFKAARDLEASRRWCVTGTPIQNSLDDFLSLLKFLHLEPYCQPAVFEQDILSPLRAGNADSFRNLKLLLKAVCLRRTSQLLDLAPVSVKIVPVSLSIEEREHYRAIQTFCQTEFEKITSQKSHLKRYSVLFTTILHLRRLCSNGQPPAQPLSVAGGAGKKRTSKNKKAKRDDNTCDVCSEEDSASLLDGFDVCPECSRLLANPTTSNNGSSTTATHLAPGTPLGTSPSRSPSPLSGVSSPSAPFPATSSKLNAVADNIAQHRHKAKSLVFTSWLSTLDSLARILQDRGIPCLQVDGRVGTSEREERLKQFKEDPSITVLLMSIQTGSVGLTLTVANRVHFVEPQWNPAVEEQAVGRAQRMGQTRPVTVVRYITEKSVEETIAALQKKKSHLARVSLDAAEQNGETTGLDDLKFVLAHDATE